MKIFSPPHIITTTPPANGETSKCAKIEEISKAVTEFYESDSRFNCFRQVGVCAVVSVCVCMRDRACGLQ